MLFLTLFVAFALAACSSPEEKKGKFYNKGKTLYEKGDYVKASLEFKNALQIDPKYADAYYMYAQTELKQGNIKRAYGFFTKTVELDPSNLDAHIQLGRFFLAGKALDRAREKVDLVLKSVPDHTEARLLQAAILLKENKSQESIKILETLRSGGMQTPELYMLLASAQVLGQAGNEAEQLLKEGVARNPDSSQLLTMLAKLYADMGKVTEATASLKKVVEMESDKPQHKYILAGYLWDNGEKEAAKATIQSVIDAKPADEESYSGAGQFYRAKGEEAMTEQIFREGLAKAPPAFTLRTQLAELFLSRGKVEEALKPLEEGLGLEKDPAHPGIVKTRVAMAEILFKAGRVDKAEETVKAALEASPKNVEATFLYGGILLSRGEMDAAIAKLQVVVKEKPEFASGHLQLAEAYALNNQMELAQETLQQAAKMLPGAPEIVRALTRVLVLRKELDKARETLEVNINIAPENKILLADLGDYWLLKEDRGKAEQNYRSLKEALPNNPLGYMKLARLHILNKEMDKARDILKEGYAKNTGNYPLFEFLVSVLGTMKEFNTANELCEKMAELYPNDARYHNLLGLARSSDVNYLRAEGSFKRAISLQPMWPDPHNNLATLYLRLGNAQNAIRQLEDSLQVNPNNSAAYLTLGVLYEQLGEIGKAKSIYKKAVAIYPNLWSAFNNLAFLIAEYPEGGGDLDSALAYAKKAAEIQPDNYVVLDTLGWVHFKKGDLSGAVGVFQKILDKDPAEPVINYHIAKVFHARERTEIARSRLLKALAGENKFPGRDDAEKLRQEISQ